MLLNSSTPALNSIISNRDSLNHNTNCIDYFNTLYQDDQDWELKEQIKDSDTYENTEIYKFIHHFNVFNHCFLKDKKASLFSQEFKLNPDIEKRIFPWLTRNYPIYMKSDGSIFTEPTDAQVKSLPQKLEDLNFDLGNISLKQAPSNTPFWTTLNHYSKRRGIILTMSDKHASMGVRLIRNLRLLGTRLPIQIIHHDEISASTSFQLLKEATGDTVSFDKELFKILDNDKINYPEFDSSFPKLDIEFINTKPAIEKHHLFEKYNRKFLAVLFNTFEEFMLVDVDVVLFMKPEQFFETSQYKQTQSLFFKDRNLVSQRVPYFNEFFQSSIPTKYDNMHFGFPLLDPSIMNKEYFEFNHVDYMESGVVCMHKLKFFPGLLMSVFLSMRRPMIESTTGDKELFWLGQLISGQSEFSFNDHWAAATGNISRGRGHLKSNEVCSTHPSHISSDTNKLMWINTGAFHCRDYDSSDFTKDFKQMSMRYPDKIQTDQDLEVYYKSPVSFEFILFPPINGDFLDLPVELNGEPRYGFLVSNCCKGYMWCGYDQIGLGETQQERGELLKVGEYDQTFYNYIVNGYTI